MLIGTGLLPYLLKLYFERPRPEDVQPLVTLSNYSFPSSHTFAATAIYIALACYSGQYSRSWLHEAFFYCLGGILIVLVGISRIYLGVYYPTDILGGIYSGAIWGLTVSAFFELLIRIKNQSLAPSQARFTLKLRIKF